MNSDNGQPGSPVKKDQASTQGRRRFQPKVAGLEARQLLSAASVGNLVSFSGSQQTYVSQMVMDSQGNLYGTTSAGSNGGGRGDATVFEIPSGSRKPNTLATFDNDEGYGINNVVVDGKGNVFGSIGQAGGAHGNGEVFEIPHDSKTVKTLATFNGSNGEFPSGVTLDGGGNLFGTTAVGWNVGGATVFEVPHASNTITTLATFNTRGAAPNGLTIDSQGNLYGINANGANGAATIYEIAHGSNTITTLAAFNADDTGVSSVAVDGQGNLYGTTRNGGGHGNGMVFEVAKGSNSVTTVASFNKTNGASPNPNVGVILDNQGNLFGTTEAGGINSEGTVFEIAKGSNTVTTVSHFKGILGTTVSGAILDGQGNLVGTTNGGGSRGAGSVFRVKLNTTTP